jgi:hypothetical protein
VVTPLSTALWESPTFRGVGTPAELAADVFHEAVYVAATGAVYDALNTSRAAPPAVAPSPSIRSA